MAEDSELKEELGTVRPKSVFLVRKVYPDGELGPLRVVENKPKTKKKQNENFLVDTGARNR